MINGSNKNCRENQNTKFILFFENHAFYEIMFKYIVEQDRPQITIWHMRIACWIPKATNTKSGYVIFTAFPRQKWLHESSSMLLLYIDGYINI
jgi:hypothetical protein